ncbi:MAG: 2Fe-2S iron-sulfur cluster-binding protein [Pseudomonadota bacterium]
MTKITFINRDGSKIEAEGKNGLYVMEVAVENGVDIEAVCEGSLACATCHLVVVKEWFGKLKPVSEDEEDMLDLAFGLTETSRLSCQLMVDDTMDGIIFYLPDDET